MKRQSNPLWLGLLVATLLLGLTIGLIPVAAQSDDSTPSNNLETVLAEAALNGLLQSLTLDSASASSLARFYITDEAEASEAGQSLFANPLSDFELVQGQWLSDNTYQASAQLSPDAQLLNAEIQQIGSRWQVVNLTFVDSLGAPISTDLQSEQSLTLSTVSTISGTTAFTVSATGTVETFGLSRRSGPGLDYAVLGYLEQGDVLDIVGASGLGTWYQIARDGQIIGWMSARSDLVTVSPTNAVIPTVAANTFGSVTNTGNTTAPLISGNRRGLMILQEQTGGTFYLLQADGSLQALSSGIDPALSPDATKVAFTRWDGAMLGELIIYDLASGTERVVLGETPQAKAPTWSPDGSKIMLNYQNGGYLYERSNCSPINSDGGFSNPPRNAFDIDVKIRNGIPNLCYKIPPDTHWKLRLVDVDSGEFQDMASDIYSYAPTWDPNNDWRVIFVSSVGLQQLDVHRNTFFPFGPGDWRDRGSVMSPDGSQVAVSYMQDNFWEVYTISAADGSRQRLTKASPLLDERYNSAAPAWSPDGTQIAFVTDRSGEWEFWVMNADGSNQRPLLPAATADLLDIQYHGVDERLITWGW